MPWMKRLLFVGVLLVVALLAARCGWSTGVANGPQHVIAAAWGDGGYGPAYYGARVWIEDAGSGRVHTKACIEIGGPSTKPNWLKVMYFDDIGLLSTEPDAAAAVAKWGKIEWTPEGVWFGAGTPHAQLIPRARVENHR